MTVDEYVLAVDELIKARDLQSWELGDLRTNVRVVRRRGRICPLDLKLLDWSGRPITGYFIKPKAYEEPIIGKKKTRQVRLFE